LEKAVSLEPNNQKYVDNLRNLKGK